MNSRIKINLVFATVVLLLSFSSAKAQVQKAHYNTYISSNCNGFYDYLPQGYSATGSTLYPVLIFVHGSWEAGSGSTTDLPKVLKHGPPHLISLNEFPTSFTVGGKTFKMIVFSPQFKDNAGASSVNAVIDYVLQHYKADPSRIYITGLSSGGGTVEYAAADPTVGKRLAAAIEFAGTASPSTAKAADIINNKVSFWGVHNKGDDIVPYTKTTGWVSDILSLSSTFPTKKTIADATGHNCWTPRYKTSYTENGLNVYQWMLQYSRGTVVKTNIPPVASAGSDKSITLPANSISLTGKGTDADGTISKYSWTKVSGPSSYSFSSTSAASTTVSSLTAGTYVFRLTVTDNSGATGADDVNVVVNSATTINAIKIEAEKYAGMQGIETETTTDAGGGLNLSAIDLSDWVYYNINASTAGNYTFTFRLASASTGGQFDVYDTYNSVKTKVATIAVPNTGSWQSWRDITATLSLKAGTHTITLYSTATPHWNINYFTYGTTTATSTTALAANTTSAAQEQTQTSVTALGVAPNPFSTNFVLQVNTKNTGTMKVQIIDMSGVVRRSFQVIKTAAGTMQTYLSASTLTKGTYVVRVQVGDWAQSTQIVKL